MNHPFCGWLVVVWAPLAALHRYAAIAAGSCETVSLLEDADGNWRLEAMCRDETASAAVAVRLALDAASAGLLPPIVQRMPIPARDWLADNRERFRPFAVGRYWVHEVGDAGGRQYGLIPLAIDAATAFGSGRHASTAGCLLALSTLRRSQCRRPLDVGSGSGILAIAMAKTWSVPVLATDIDPHAVAVAARNARLNGVGRRVMVSQGEGYRVPAVEHFAPFDLIVSNILARPLCRLAIDLGRHLTPRGAAILSGFLDGDARAVFAAHRLTGLRLCQRISIDGWQTLLLQRTVTAP